MTKKRQLQLQVSPELLYRLKHMRISKGCTLSDYAERAIMGQLRRDGTERDTAGWVAFQRRWSKELAR